MEIDLTKYKKVKIQSVKQTGKKIQMSDIQVKDNETFVLSNGILTHNSAIAKFVEIRNPEFQASMPLKGKVLNVYNKAPIDVMSNTEVADIFTAINLEFNEQLGEFIIDEKNGTYKLIFESLFEVTDNGDPLVITAILNGNDRYKISNKWIKIKEIFENKDLYHNYIIEISEVKEQVELTPPDYFHFRRLFDYRGYRLNGVKYNIQIGRTKFICNDIDDILVKGKWLKVANLIKKSVDGVVVTKAPTDSVLTFQHKLLNPKFNSVLKYSRVQSATDADPDGSAINNLLVNLFHEFFPELFWNEEMPFMYRIIFPMISAHKGKKVLYYKNRETFDIDKDNGKVDDTWKITYYKGLGSMADKDWEYVFDNLDDYLFPIIDDGYLDELLAVFFDSNPDIRKEWLSII